MQSLCNLYVDSSRGFADESPCQNCLCWFLLKELQNVLVRNIFQGVDGNRLGRAKIFWAARHDDF